MNKHAILSCFPRRPRFILPPEQVQIAKDAHREMAIAPEKWEEIQKLRTGDYKALPNDDVGFHAALRDKQLSDITRTIPRPSR